jgi:hypothetical protein
MTKLRQRMNGKGVPTQSQPQAASLTLSACKVANPVQERFKKLVFRKAPARQFICFYNLICGRIMVTFHIFRKIWNVKVNSLKLLIFINTDLINVY